MSQIRLSLFAAFVWLALPIALAQETKPTAYLLKPARLFDGEQVREGFAVIVRGDKIESVAPLAELKAPADAKVIELPNATLLPGLIEAHSHVLLHPYSETPWNDQVAREHLSLRIARATNHLRNTLLAGFTTIRDLGTEGADYTDVGGAIKSGTTHVAPAKWGGSM